MPPAGRGKTPTTASTSKPGKYAAPQYSPIIREQTPAPIAGALRGNTSVGTQQYQMALAQLGALPCSQVTGVWNAQTSAAVPALTRYMAKNGQTTWEAVNELAKAMPCTGGKSGGSKGGGGRRGGGGSSGGGGGSTGPTVSRQIRITDRDTARSYLRSYMKDELGRDPTETELDVFVGSLNGAERANPTVTTTTVAGNTQTSETIAGLNPSAYSENYAQKDVAPQERGQYQGAKYYDVLSNLIAGGG